MLINYDFVPALQPSARALAASIGQYREIVLYFTMVNMSHLSRDFQRYITFIYISTSAFKQLILTNGVS